MGARALIAAALAGGLLLATAAGVWAQQTPVKAAPAPAPAPAKTAHKNPVDRVEARVVQLHEQLGITPAQEPAWNNFVQVMRENAKDMKARLDQRAQRAKNMDAVSELRSHAEMAEIYAAGLHKLVPAFETLYNMMPEDQKKVADQAMTYHEKRHRKKAK